MLQYCSEKELWKDSIDYSAGLYIIKHAKEKVI